MSDPYRNPATLTTAREAFEDIDRQFVDAVRRVMTAETSEAPFAVTRHVNWTEFRKEPRVRRRRAVAERIRRAADPARGRYRSGGVGTASRHRGAEPMKDPPAILTAFAKTIADQPKPHVTTIEDALHKAYRMGAHAAMVRAAEHCCSVRDEYMSPDRREPAHRCAERVLTVGLCEADRIGLGPVPQTPRGAVSATFTTIVWVDLRGEELVQAFVRWLDTERPRILSAVGWGQVGGDRWHHGYSAADADRIRAWVEAWEAMHPDAPPQSTIGSK